MTSLDHKRVDRLVCSFDHWAPELAVDPQSVYQALRDRCPVAHSDKYGGFWVLSRYEDIEAAARDAATFSSTSVSIPLEIGMGGLPIPPLDQDPPEHTRFRQQLLPFFFAGPHAEPRAFDEESCCRAHRRIQGCRRM